MAMMTWQTDGLMSLGRDGDRALPQRLLARVRARARVLAAWTAHLWSCGQSSVDQGLAITAAEVERILLEPVETETHRNSFLTTNDLPKLVEASRHADRELEEEPYWASLTALFGLSVAEADLLCLLVAVELEPRLQRVMAYLQDDVRATRPTAALAAGLFETDAAGPVKLDNLLRWGLVHAVDSGAATVNAVWSNATAWRADGSVVLSVAAGEWVDPEIVGIAELIAPDQAEARPCLYPETLAAMEERSLAGEVALTGPVGSGRKTLAAQYASRLNKPLLAVRGQVLIAGQTPVADSLRAVARMAQARGALMYWRDAEAIAAADWERLRVLAPVVLRGARNASSTADWVFELAPLKTEQRVMAWKYHSRTAPPEMLLTQRLTSGEIAIAAKAADAAQGAQGSVRDEAMRAALRRAMPVQSELMQLLPCPYAWDDLVVSWDLQKKLQEFEAQVRLRWEVYEGWGFSRLTHLGQGISALFGGPSGTGKTMAAQVLARSLHLDVYRVDLAGVVNKYIGETEKRLREVFDACERSGSLLFFDEADALFGSRMQAKDAHDRFANIEIDYLLQRIEQFDGIAILATNRKNDLDAAFLRRLRFVIDFLPPGPPERLTLWQKALVPYSPAGERILGEIDFDLLANTIDLTGAQIKAIALGAAFLARAEGQRIEMEHVVLAAQRELAKHGLVVRGPLGKSPLSGKMG